MDDFTLTGNRESMVLAFEGEMVIERAEQLKTSLCDALEAAQHIAINLEKVTKVGLPCLQLLCSAHQSALSHQKILSFQGDVPEAFWSAVEEAGYSHRIGHSDDRENGCLWINGEAE